MREIDNLIHDDFFAHDVTSVKNSAPKNNALTHRESLLLPTPPQLELLIIIIIIHII